MPSYFTKTQMPSGSFTARTNAFTFEWAGQMWVVGGIGTNLNPLSDVWKSGDFGRTWTQVTAAAGLGPCSTGTTSADISGGRVTLVCAGFPNNGQVHADIFRPGGSQATYYSTDPALATWSAVTDPSGPYGLFSFTVNRMAVPFDGAGTLVSLGGGSITGTTPSAQNAVYLSTNSANTWTTTAAAPWTPRYGHSTTTDYLRLTLILAAGLTVSTTGTTSLTDDVWQLTWTRAGVQQWYQLQVTANFPVRKFAAMYHVHDWLFLYGGSTDTAAQTDSMPLDDVWASADYGTTWNQMSTNGTGIARHGVVPLSISRRLFVVGGSPCLPGTGGPTPATIPVLNDVWVAYW